MVAAAEDVLRQHYRPFWHTVAAALRMADGRIVTGIHLGATVGRMSVCAEPIAVGRAILEGGGPILRAVAVRGVLVVEHGVVNTLAVGLPRDAP